MQKINISGVPFDISKSTGTIIDLGSHSNSQTMVHGGGGRISTNVFGQVGGKIDPVNVTTTTTNTQDIHYKDNNGKEDFVRIANLDLPLRPGQEIEIHQININDEDFSLFLVVNNLQRKFDIINYNSLVEYIYRRKNKHSRITTISLVITLSVCGYILYSFGLSTFKTTMTAILGLFVFFFLYSKLTSFSKSMLLGEIEVDIKKYWKTI